MTGTVICDLDGVVYVGDTSIPGSGDALNQMIASGYNLVFATNNSSRTLDQVASKITRLSGYEARPNQIVGSAAAAAAMLEADKPETFVVGGDGITEALRHYGIPVSKEPDQAGAVVIGLRMDFTYDDLRDAADAVRRGARFIATNVDATLPTSEGLAPGAGALVAAVERASGLPAEVAGKPNGPMLKLLAERTGPGPVWVVGDRAETDLAMAHAAGWTSVLVLGGVTERAADVPPDLAPDHVIRSIAELPELLSA